MSLRAVLHGVRVFIKQVCCHPHEMERSSVTVVGSYRCVSVMVCRKCGWTDLHPLVW